MLFGRRFFLRRLRRVHHCLLVQILFYCYFLQRGKEVQGKELALKSSFPSREWLGALPLTILTALCEMFIYRLRRGV